MGCFLIRDRHCSADRCSGCAGYQKIGSTTSAVFSLHATKPLAVGEGGFVATACREFADRVRTRSNFGFESGEVKYLGTNAKLSEYHAAVGMAALQGWPRRKARRQALYEAYAETLDRPELRSAVSLRRDLARAQIFACKCTTTWTTAILAFWPNAVSKRAAGTGHRYIATPPSPGTRAPAISTLPIDFQISF